MLCDDSVATGWGWVKALAAAVEMARCGEHSNQQTGKVWSALRSHVSISVVLHNMPCNQTYCSAGSSQCRLAPGCQAVVSG